MAYYVMDGEGVHPVAVIASTRNRQNFKKRRWLDGTKLDFEVTERVIYDLDPRVPGTPKELYQSQPIPAMSDRQQIGKDDLLTVDKKLIIDAGDQILIKTGSASITMNKDGTITIKGKNITVDGSGKINIKASGDVVVKGSKITQN